MRKHYLDNIRWIIVVLVLIYHVFYLFNSVGVLGGVGSFSNVQYQDAVLYFVYPWLMVILFVISGMSANLALKKRTNKQFIKERTLKLLVPSTLGLFAIQWIVGYFNIKVGGGWELIPSFMRYPIMVLSGTGPLWFIQMLWLFSLLIVLIRKIDKKDKLLSLGSKCTLPIIILLFIPLWGAAQVFNMPVITTYRFGIYFIAFLIGYYILSHDIIMEKIEKIHIPFLFISIIMGIAYTWHFFGTNYSADASLKHIFTNVYLWVSILAILGCAKAWLNKTSKFSNYMAKSSFGIYILHYLTLLPTCYFLKVYTHLPTIAVYIIATSSVLLITPVLYEIIRKIPVLRFLVLGIKKNKNL